MFKEEFLKSLKSYASEQEATLWSEVEKNYTKRNRYYHTLAHLDGLTKELIPFQPRFVNWDAVVFAIAYHDIVYNPLKNNNEEKSADLATQRLSTITFPAEQLVRCKEMILATKTHGVGDDEINLFTDADLSILGTSAGNYVMYSQQIRREYSIYPDIIYNPGRKKVLIHFLTMDRIYKTTDFFSRYEETARINLQSELDRIS